MSEPRAIEARPKLWTPEILASYLGVPVSWVYKRTRKNGPELIPHVKLGKYVRFDPESVAFQEWLEAHHMNPHPVEADSLTTGLPAHRLRLTEKTGHIS